VGHWTLHWSLDIGHWALVIGHRGIDISFFSFGRKEFVWHVSIVYTVIKYM